MRYNSLPGSDALKNKTNKQNLNFNSCHQRLLIWSWEPRMQKPKEPTCPSPWGWNVFLPVFGISRTASMVGMIFKLVGIWYFPWTAFMRIFKKSVSGRASKLTYSSTSFYTDGGSSFVNEMHPLWTVVRYLGVFHWRCFCKERLRNSRFDRFNVLCFKFLFFLSQVWNAQPENTGIWSATIPA